MTSVAKETEEVTETVVFEEETVTMVSKPVQEEVVSERYEAKEE